MYKRIKLSDETLLGLRILKDITSHENQTLIDLIQRHFQKHGPVRMLLVYEANPGLMGAEDLYDNLRFVKFTSDNIAKMAVIGQHGWESTWVGLFGLFGGMLTNYYSDNQVDAALSWLKA